MTKDEALHKALKVLNCLNNDRVYETAWVKGAINACEEALNLSEKQYTFPDKNIPAQEASEQSPCEQPVAWLHIDGDSTCTNNTKKYGGVDKEYSIPLYTHPHQWQGLTADEIRHCLYEFNTQDFIQFARAIEQALKEKNHV
jgi:hypothetical protein